MAPQCRRTAYAAQLLRIWLENPDGHHPAWRFSLEDVATGERSGFADLDALIAHLLTVMEALVGQIEAEEKPGKPSGTGLLQVGGERVDNGFGRRSNI